MNKLKYLLLFLTTLLFAEEASPDPARHSESKIDLLEKITFPYVLSSDQWFICPGLGFGYRTHGVDRRFGWNVVLSGYSYWDAGFSLYGKGHYLFYPAKEKFYVGLGAGVIGGHFYSFSGGSPLIGFSFGDGPFCKPTIEGLIGWEWGDEKSPRFIQLEMGGSYGTVPLYPVLSFGTGF